MARPRIESILNPPPGLKDFSIKTQRIAEQLVIDYQMGSGGSHPQVMARWIKMERAVNRELLGRLTFMNRKQFTDDEVGVFYWVFSRGGTRE